MYNLSIDGNLVSGFKYLMKPTKKHPNNAEMEIFYSTDKRPPMCFNDERNARLWGMTIMMSTQKPVDVIDAEGE